MMPPFLLFSVLTAVSICCLIIKVEGVSVKKPPKLVNPGSMVTTSSDSSSSNRMSDMASHRADNDALSSKSLIQATTTTTTNNNNNNNNNSKEEEGDSALNQLLEVIFSKYHKELVPVRPTTVKLDLLLLKVKSTIEKEGIFESVIALFMEWQDKRMRWDPRLYDNVTILAFDSDKVWLPDIAMTNSADHLYSISKDTRFVVRVTHDGGMKFVPTGTARTWCDLKLLTFPFDIQTCSFEFESWSLDATTMTFNDTCEALVDDSFSSPQWELCQRNAAVYQHVYNFTAETFTRVRFDFVVRRKSTFYIINLIFPCATLSLIQLLVFVIPSTDSTSDRVGFGTTNLLTLVVFQTIVTAEMPKSSDAVTALSKYIIALIIISAVGIFESVIAERLLRKTLSPPPEWVVGLMAICPLLWGSQLPAGISQMILEGGDYDKYAGENHKDNDDDEDDDKKKLKKSGCFCCRCCCCRREQRNNNNDDEKARLSRSNSKRVQKKKGGAIKKAKRHSSNKSNIIISPHHTSAPHIAARFGHRRISFQRKLQKENQQKVNNGCECVWPNNSNETAARFGKPSDVDDYIMATLRHFNKPPTISVISDGGENSLNYCQTPFNRTSFADSLASSGDAGYLLAETTTATTTKSYRTAAAIAASLTTNKTDNEIMAAKTAAEDNDTKKLQNQLFRIQNGILWGELVTKVDHLVFIVCTALAIFIPLFLFVPLIVFDEKCRVSQFGENNISHNNQ